MIENSISDSAPKKKFTVTIEEHISGGFSVCADSLYEALEIAEEKYFQGEFIVNSAPPSCRLITAHDNETDSATEWREF